jgi:uncharacterized OB-fold protein
LAKQAPVPDELSKPFWDACNEHRLVMQTCTACNMIHFPPKPSCDNCDSKDNLEWKEMSGRATIYSYGVMYDSRIRVLQESQPFNIAIVKLEEDPEIIMYSHLPGVAVDEVPMGAKVKVTFEESSTGQWVPEWELAD